MILGDPAVSKREDVRRFEADRPPPRLDALKCPRVCTGPAPVDGHSVVGGEDLHNRSVQIREGDQELLVASSLPVAAPSLPVADEVFGDDLVDHSEQAVVDHPTIEAFDQRPCSRLQPRRLVLAARGGGSIYRVSRGIARLHRDPGRQPLRSPA